MWIGHAEAQLEMADVEIHGERYPRVMGGTVPAPMWADFMTKFLQGVSD